MDRRTLFAVVLIAAIVVLYPFLLKLTGAERYLRPAPPPSTVTDTVATGSAPEPAAPPEAPGTPPASAPGHTAPIRSSFTAAAPPADSAALRRTYAIETDLYRAEFEPRGARLKRVELKRYRAAIVAPGGRSSHGSEVPEAERVVLAGGPTLALDLGSEQNRRSLADALYAVTESTDAAGQVLALTFVARDSSGAMVRQTWRSRPGTYALDLEIAIEDIPFDWGLSDYSFTLRSWPLVTEHNQVEDERALQASALMGRDLRRDHAAGLRTKPRRYDGAIGWGGVTSRYFMAAVAVGDGAGKAVLQSASLRTLSPEERGRLGPTAPREQLVAESQLVMGLPSRATASQRYVVYTGPRDYFLLHKLGLGLDRVVEMGWTWVVPFSRVLLQVLKWLHGALPNYGVAILLLATLVRVLLHPLNLTSMRSMRAMQKLQPEVERLRAKYKQNPQDMNKALMALYRENKVNPAGGCLPMVVQMPIFFALYSVLFHAIELRQAPFVLWMQDLSAPDLLFQVGLLPVRLLPILMAGSGLLQQKMTPTDPRQATSMYIMNVVMVVFFYNLPSGLVLYWTVMNLLTALQQWLVLREDGSGGPASRAVVVTPAVVKKGRGK